MRTAKPKSPEAEPGIPGNPGMYFASEMYFAAERPLLAWVRTGLAMTGFGFVVAKFGLFLREIAHVRGLPPHRQSGTALMVFGVAVSLGAAVGHRRTVRRLERERPLRFRRLSLAVATAGLLGTLRLSVAVYLLAGLGDSG
ncbi:YidH family protein [Gemmata sp.]|uniref:YidH family protein n=1 Tax=Gemmata sp. TaxID=1914242 RepID=UPI003F720E66